MSPLRRCPGHAAHAPAVPVQIDEVVIVHEAVIGGLAVGGAAGGAGAADDLIHLLARVELQGQEHLVDLAGVRDPARGEVPEHLMAEQHRGEVRAEVEARGAFTAEGRIQAEAERREEGGGGLDVLHGEIDEELLGGDRGRGGGGGAHGFGNVGFTLATHGAVRKGQGGEFKSEALPLGARN